MPADFGIPHLFAYLIATIHALGVLAAIHAVLTVRTAQGALAWGLSLFFMPYLTLLPYLVFGRSRFDAYVKARRQADKEMHHAMAEQDWRPWAEEAKAAHLSPAYDRLRAPPRRSRAATSRRRGAPRARRRWSTGSARAACRCRCCAAWPCGRSRR